MKSRLIILLLSLACQAIAQQGDTVTLFQCHALAIETHPLSAQRELLLQSLELNQKNRSVHWFPELDLNGRYTWQNEVVELPIPLEIPGFETPAMPNYNYKLTLDIQQTLYDGGMGKKGKELEESLYEVKRQQVEVSLNQLKGQVNNMYFYILVLQEQEKTMLLKRKELDARLESMESLVRNEAVLASELNILRAEALKVDQQLAEIRISHNSAMEVLSQLTMHEMDAETYLKLPSTEFDPALEGVLPEQVLYDLRIKNLDASINMTERQRFPKAYVFGQFGYGNPALNFFRDEFRGYYIVGGGLSWKIWDWSKTSREKQVLAVQQDLIRTQKEAFDKNLYIKLEELMANILKYEEAVQRDEEILELREEITMSSVSKLENGVITSSDYIARLNAEIQARIQLHIHRIQLEQAKISYQTSKGII